MSKITFTVGGMTCAACSAAVERALLSMGGVKDVAVNLATGKVTVEYEDPANPKGLFAAVRNSGYNIVTGGRKEEAEREAAERRSLKRSLILAAVFAIPLFYVSMGHMFGAPIPEFLHDKGNMALFQLALCIPAVFAGRMFYVRGFPALFRRSPDMDSLIAVATSTAFVSSLYATYSILYGDGSAENLMYYEAAAMIITLVLLGNYLESGSKKKVRAAVDKLMDLAPEYASVIVDGKEVKVPADSLIVGDVVVVRPGERFPADGRVISGFTSADESMLTGESVPIDKELGSMVYRGSMNLNGSVQVNVTVTGDETVLSQIIGMVEEAQSSKAPISKIADRVVRRFVPAVMLVAVLACLGWMMVGMDLRFSLTVLISVLVIACPCALGLATPLAIIMGTARGAETGILFKDAAALQMAGEVTAVAFDKTGTITEGVPRVVSLVAVNDRRYAMTMAAAAESKSEHPLGKSIVRCAEKRGLEIPEATDFEALVGSGISCTVEGKKVLVGKKGLMEERGIDVSMLDDDEARLSAAGRTVVYVAVDGKAEGLIALADAVRKSSAEAMSSLGYMGIRTMMITGDAEATAAHVAADAGITEYVSRALPGDKVGAVRKLSEQGEKVAMVGDGINDAPALIASDLGIAVSSGTDIAMESADIVVVGDDLNSVPMALSIGKATLGNIKQNLFLALCYNVLCIPLAAGLLYLFGGPLLNPMIAAGAMSLSSVSVVTNALRLGKMRIEPPVPTGHVDGLVDKPVI